MRVALVNDLQLALESLRRAVARIPGATVAWIAMDGAEAVSKCAADVPDVLLMDMIMPVMNGKETFLALKAVNPDVVALVASGYSLETETEEILRSGVRGFLQKPFKMEDLAKGVTEVLSGQSRTSRNPTAG